MAQTISPLKSTQPPSYYLPPKRFNFKKADWSNFIEDCKKTLNPNIETKTIEFFTEKLIETTDRNIPKISSRPRKNKSWFNEECTKAVKHKKHMLRLAKKNPTNENIKIFKIAQANCRQICRTAKKQSFQKYISKINNNTPMSKIWKMIKKLKGTNKETIKHITKEDGTMAETESDIANEIANSLSNNSSSKHYNNKFQKTKSNEEKKKIDFSSSNLENYNKSFTLSEIKACLSDLSQTAAGPDDINNIVLSNLPSESVTLLLDIFNNIWTNKQFPDS